MTFFELVIGVVYLSLDKTDPLRGKKLNYRSRGAWEMRVIVYDGQRDNEYGNDGWSG